MTTPYEPQVWADEREGGTALSADRLNHIEQGIATADTARAAVVAETLARQGADTSIHALLPTVLGPTIRNDWPPDTHVLTAADLTAINPVADNSDMWWQVPFILDRTVTIPLGAPPTALFGGVEVEEVDWIIYQGTPYPGSGVFSGVYVADNWYNFDEGARTETITAAEVTLEAGVQYMLYVVPWGAGDISGTTVSVKGVLDAIKATGARLATGPFPRDGDVVTFQGGRLTPVMHQMDAVEDVVQMFITLDVGDQHYPTVEDKWIPKSIWKNFTSFRNSAYVHAVANDAAAHCEIRTIDGNYLLFEAGYINIYRVADGEGHILPYPYEKWTSYKPDQPDRGLHRSLDPDGLVRAHFDDAPDDDPFIVWKKQNNGNRGLFYFGFKRPGTYLVSGTFYAKGMLP